jgi:DNA repair protein RecO
MGIIKTTGIAISSQTYAEADVLCTYYTKDFGKRKFIIKGLKKSKKRSFSAVEPGAVTDLVCYSREGKDACVVNELNVLKFYSSITGSLQKILHLYFMLDFVDKTCGYNIADSGIYNLLLTGIGTLSKTSFPVHLSAFFILHLLKIHGLLPDSLSCKLCGSGDFSRFVLDIIDLRPVCNACRQRTPAISLPKEMSLGTSTSEFIPACFAQKFISLDHNRYQEKELLDLIYNITLFVENYFHTELKSKSLILSAL